MASAPLAVCTTRIGSGRNERNGWRLGQWCQSFRWKRLGSLASSSTNTGFLFWHWRRGVWTGVPGRGGGQLSGAVCAVQSVWQRDTSASDILFEVEGGPQETSSFIVGSRKGRETSMTGFFFSLFVHGHCRPLCIMPVSYTHLTLPTKVNV